MSLREVVVDEAIFSPYALFLRKEKEVSHDLRSTDI
jgi:hypothetical protein